jgi:hypothetical protein
MTVMIPRISIIPMDIRAYMDPMINPLATCWMTKENVSMIHHKIPLPT